MHIVIGILAWNEETSIGKTIGGLRGQTMLEKWAGKEPGEEPRGNIVEIIVVPNGCTDLTAEVAAASLEDLQTHFPGLRARVEALQIGSKTHAWNEFVHRLSPPDADYFILMDADIELLTPTTLEDMVQALEENPHPFVATDVPVKHISKKKRLTLRDRMLVAVGGMTKATPGQLTGQLYCARAGILRRVTIPKGLIVEDGFLKQILCTNGYTEPVDNTRILRVETASHMFECYTKFRDIWNHQVRQAVGHTLYTYLTKYLREENARGEKAFALLAERTKADAGWYEELIRNEVARRGWWVMDTPSLTMRFRRVRFAKGPRKLVFLAVALAAFPFDLIVFLVSNHRLRSGRVGGIWKDTRTTAIT
jgi:glycosyltransferase involved in cell wall biosynthesis